MPEEVYDDFKEKIVEQGEKSEKEWNELFEAYKEKYPEEAAEFETAMKGELT